MNRPKVLFRVHAIQRMIERNISARKISKAIQAGVTIEDYSAEMPGPSRLILGFQGKRPLHIVTSENPETKEITIITVYVTDPGKWTKDFKSRRS